MDTSNPGSNDRSGVSRTVSGVRNLILQFDQPPDNLLVSDGRNPNSRSISPNHRPPRKFGTVTESRVRFMEKEQRCPYQHEETITILQEKIQDLQNENKKLNELVEAQKLQLEALTQALANTATPTPTQTQTPTNPSPSKITTPSKIKEPVQTVEEHQPKTATKAVQTLSDSKDSESGSSHHHQKRNRSQSCGPSTETLELKPKKTVTGNLSKKKSARSAKTLSRRLSKNELDQLQGITTSSGMESSVDRSSSSRATITRITKGRSESREKRKSERVSRRLTEKELTDSTIQEERGSASSQKALSEKAKKHRSVPNPTRVKSTLEEIQSPSKNEPNKAEDASSSQSQSPLVSSLEASRHSFMNENKNENWVIPYDDLVMMEKIGKGVSSTVFKGSWKGQQVAIKVLHLLHEKDFKDFKEELAIMSQVQSPHLVRFYGATLEKKITCVMELCINGSLFHRLQDVTHTLINWERVLKWSAEVAKGIAVLHDWNPVIFHRDLKTLNLLLDMDWNIKVCDFGLSRFNTEATASQTLTKLRGTYSYTAPELYHKNPYTAKSDVFSIGIIIWEMSTRVLSGRYVRPYSEYKEIKMDYQIIFKVATKDLRPTIPENCPEDLKKTIEQCWSKNPDERPTCRQLAEMIGVTLKQYKKKKSKWKKTEAKVEPPKKY